MLVWRKQTQTAAAEYQVALSQCFETDSSAVGSVLGLTNQALNTALLFCTRVVYFNSVTCLALKEWYISLQHRKIIT